MQSLRTIAEIRQANAGLTAKNEALERRVAESIADYKQELQSLEGRHLKASKEYRADAGAKIDRLEQDVFTLKAKVQILVVMYYVCLLPQYLSSSFLFGP